MKPQQDLSVSEQRFPAGMRVLVVDDDTTCLKLMDKLLRKCQYIVTTTNRAKEALRILKENKNRFDIVISDVEMPDMDGIKLLQLIGLEMNIPVIMLSAYSDTKRVMQGIRNGACDYLVKPVRIQELQNIWQHIVRRNKSMTIRRPRYLAADEDEKALVPSNANASSSERRKGKSIQGNSSGGDDDDNDDEEQEDSGRENESTNQKKPRLFWSVELHQKFVDAVDSLGIEKAFPKKILDLMNVEGLTREKVASHLQKYRLYLRKVNSDTNQPPSKISAYDDGHIGPLGGGYGIFRSLAGATGRFPSTNPAMPHPVLLGRLNTAAGLSIRGLASSPMLQSAQVPNSSSSFPPFGKFEPAAPSANPSPALFQSFPSLQSNRGSFLYPQTNTIMTNQNVTSGFGNQASLFVPPSSIGPLGGIGSSATNLLNPNGGLSNWGSSIQPSLQPQAFQQNIFQSNTSGDGIVPQMANIQNVQSDPLDYFGGISSRNELNRNLQAPDRLNGNGINSFNNSGQVPIWQDQRPHYNFESCNMSGGSSSAVPVVAPGDQMMSENETHMSASPFSQLEGGSAQSVQENEVQEGNMKFDDFLIEDPKLIAGASNGGSEYLEDIVGRFLKQDDGETAQGGDDFDLDTFSV